MDIINDQSLFIRENVRDVWFTICFGGFLALLITYLFLRDIRATIIGGLSIPTSIIATFFLMKVMGFTLNNMSLMGLSLAVGFLIDDAIVLVENVSAIWKWGRIPFRSQRRHQRTHACHSGDFHVASGRLCTDRKYGGNRRTVFPAIRSDCRFRSHILHRCRLLADPHDVCPLAQKSFKKKREDGPGRPEWITKILDAFNSGFEAVRAFYEEIMAIALHHPVKIIITAFATLIFNIFLMPFLGTEFQRLTIPVNSVFP